MKVEMKKLLMAGASLCVVLGLADSGKAAETREVTILQDTGANRMITKTYDLQNSKAADVLPFVSGAIEAVDSSGSIKSLNYSKGGRQILVVTMRADRVKQIDDVIKKLDKPGLNGTGIYNFSYSFKYRDADAELGNKGEADGGLRNLIEKVMDSSDATYFIDESSVYFKDSKSDGSGYLKVFEELDKPVPQAEITIKRYEVFEDDFMDLGVNYNQWQNLYKAEWFDYTWGRTGDLGWEGDSNIKVPLVQTNKGQFFGGAFDFYMNASFLRMANKLDKDIKMTQASIVVRNNSSLDPELSVGDLNFKIRPTVYQPNNLVQARVWITGEDGDDKEYYFTRCKIRTNEETTIFHFSDEIEAEEYVGIPWLGDIPVLKYLFGREISVKRKLINFITITAKPVQLDTNMNEMVNETISNAQFK